MRISIVIAPTIIRRWLVVRLNNRLHLHAAYFVYFKQKFRQYYITAFPSIQPVLPIIWKALFVLSLTLFLLRDAYHNTDNRQACHQILHLTLSLQADGTFLPVHYSFDR